MDYFSNPNAPTGLLVTSELIEDILKHNSESIVVIDEAYIDFGGEKCCTTFKEISKSFLITQTFLKFRSLAGITSWCSIRKYGNYF